MTWNRKKCSPRTKCSRSLKKCSPRPKRSRSNKKCGLRIKCSRSSNKGSRVPSVVGVVKSVVRVLIVVRGRKRYSPRSKCSQIKQKV